jgi:hypothetical protein
MWLAGGSAVAIGATVSVALLSQAPRAVGERISGLSHQPEQTGIETALPSAPPEAVRVTVEAESSGRAAGARDAKEFASESQRLDAKQSEAPAVKGRLVQGARSQKGGPRARVSATLRTKIDAPNSNPASPSAASSSTLEVPEFLPVAPESTAKEEGAEPSIGANQSPILD